LPSSLRAIMLPANISCSDSGSTSGPSVVMLALSASPVRRSRGVRTATRARQKLVRRRQKLVWRQLVVAPCSQPRSQTHPRRS
jgi:hypothetical protein